MKATMAVFVREVMARRELLLLAVAVAIMISLLPFLPNIETYEATDVRTVGSSVSALALGCVLALVFGATVFGNDLSEGRLGFFFARPVSGLALWWGRVLAVMALIWIVEITVLVPALYSEGVDIFTSSDGVDWLTILSYIIAPLLLFLLAHAVSIMARARTPWLILDMGGALVVAIFGWLNLKPLFEIGAPIALLVIAGCLIAALLIALSIGGASGVAVGRVDLKRTHSALSLALWGTLAICVTAITVYGSWLRDFGPRDFDDVDVMTVAPDGGWIEAVGRAKGRLDIERRYLISTTAKRWLPLPSRMWGLESDVVYSLDGSTAGWRGAGPVEEPRTVWWTDLGRPDPMARATNLVVSPEAALSLSADGALLAILEEGTVSVYELAEERLVKAVRLPEDIQRFAFVFTSPNTLRLYALFEIGGISSLRIAEIDVTTGEYFKRGEISGVGETFWFSVDAALEHMVVSTRSGDNLVSERRLHDAKSGAWIRNLDVAGYPRFLQDGRLYLASDTDDGSITLVVEPIEGEGRIVHTIGAAFGSSVSGEAVPNGLLVSHLVDPADRTQGIRLTLFDVDTGETRNIGSHLRSTARWFPWHPGIDMGFIWHCNQPEVSRLFIDQSGALVRWDPESGEMVHVVGGAG
jgi:hypothetical protein